jgi:hypothetical protein
LQALGISVSAALFAAGCGVLAVLAPAQTASQPATAKATGAARKSPKSTAVAKSTAAKSTASKSTAATPAAVKSSAAKSTTRSVANTRPATTKGTAGKSATKPVASSYRAPQQQPTPDRYKEIQQALADRGYFAGPVDGNWGPACIDALKRFQHDQSLLEDGKVGALSLIALGLGPKRQTAAPPNPSASPSAEKGAEAPKGPEGPEAPEEP